MFPHQRGFPWLTAEILRQYFHAGLWSIRYAIILLVQVTDESHPDKPHLLVAMTAMTEVAATINEFKRRKDLGTYRYLA